ncbi:MAG: hypothetical protein LBH02_01285 [Methanocalculaceae archaeon]|jgi:hypothetical protein|nr:hypothetical protein [Methanocalculaceae archaeon]
MRSSIILHFAMILSLVVAVADRIDFTDAGLMGVTFESFMHTCVLQQKKLNWCPKIGNHWCTILPLESKRLK